MRTLIPALILALLAMACPVHAENSYLVRILGKHLDVLARVNLIQSLNLLNGLDLNDDQQKTLMKILEAMRAQTDRFSREVEARREEAMQSLDELHDQVVRGVHPNEELGKKVHEIVFSLQALKRDQDHATNELCSRFLAHLSPSQCLVVARYKPCLVPQPVTPEQTAIGSADTGVGITRGLEKIREVNPLVWVFVRNKLAKKAAADIARHLPCANEGKLQGEMSQIFERVRAMSDVDWALQRKKVAMEIGQRFKILKGERPEDVPVGDKVRKFLLNPDLIPVLKKRIS